MAYKGSCPDMCPESERRARFGLYMSIFEYNQHTNEPDERAMVKEYRRSGADQEEPAPQDLRTPKALERTMDYLVCNLFDDPRSTSQDLALDWYDFLWDRLRAIRKDLTQQNICDPTAAILVERCARFHVHSCYAMNRVKDFDVDMNKRNLNDCLQMLRQMYADLKVSSNLACRGEFEFQKYDILLHLSEDHLSSNVLMQTSDYRSTDEMKFVIKLFNAFTSNDFFNFFQLMQQADYMTSCILSLYANRMRILAMKLIISALPARQTTLYPIELIEDALRFDNFQDLTSFATSLQIPVQEKDSKFYLALSRELIVQFRGTESSLLPFKSKRLVEEKMNGQPVGQLVYGDIELPQFHHEEDQPMQDEVYSVQDVSRDENGANEDGPRFEDKEQYNCQINNDYRYEENVSFAKMFQALRDERKEVKETTEQTSILGGGEKRTHKVEDEEEVVADKSKTIKRQKQEDNRQNGCVDMNAGSLPQFERRLPDKRTTFQEVVVTTVPSTSTTITTTPTPPAIERLICSTQNDGSPRPKDQFNFCWFANGNEMSTMIKHITRSPSEVAQMMPAGKFRKYALKKKVPTLKLPPTPTTELNLQPITKTSNEKRKSFESMSSQVEDEENVNKIFAQLANLITN